MHMEGLEQNRRGRGLLRCNIHIYLQVYLSIRVVFFPCRPPRSCCSARAAPRAMLQDRMHAVIQGRELEAHRSSCPDFGKE